MGYLDYATTADVGRMSRRSQAGILVGLVLLRALVYAAQGAGYVMDDWAIAGHRLMHGPLHTAATPLLEHPRPGLWLTYSTAYGLAGDHPLVMFAIVTVVNVAVVVLLWRTLSRFVSTTTAFLVAAVWVVLPTHNALTVWGAALQAVVALCLFLLGVDAFSRGRWIWGTLALVGGMWSYELVTMPALLTPLLLPGRLQLDPPDREVDWRRRAVALAVLVLAAIRSATNTTYPVDLHFIDVPRLWWSQFGTSLWGTEAVPRVVQFLVAAAVGVGVVVALVAWWRGDRDRESGPTLVLAGMGVIGVGSVTGFTFPLASYGLSDRLSAVSSIGAALVAVGVARLVWSHQRRLAVGAAAAFVAICVFGQAVSLWSWSQAGKDVEAVLREAEERLDDPGSTRVVVGVGRLERNNVPGIDPTSDDFVWRVRYGEDAPGTLLIALTDEYFVRLGSEDLLLHWPEVVDIRGGDLTHYR